MNKSGIYEIKNIINNNIYIGSLANLNKRKYSHFIELSKNKHGNLHLQNAYNKYGGENFIFEVLEYVEDKNELIKIEQYYIDWLEPQYNICKIAGSNLGRKNSEQSKIKMLNSAKNKPKMSEKTKKKISENSAKYWLGKKIPKEFCKNMSEAHKGKPLSDETKRKLSESHKGKNIGTNNPMYGGNFSEDHKRKISENHARFQSKLTTEQVIEIRRLFKLKIDSVDIAKQFNVSYSIIYNIRINKTYQHVPLKD
jgi:group I intron endonuclease